MNDIRRRMKENDDNKSNINLHETQKTNQWMRFWWRKIEEENKIKVASKKKIKNRRKNI